MNVTIIGTGYVGLTTGLALAYLGPNVTCIDKNPQIVEQLRAGCATVHSKPGLDEVLRVAKDHGAFRPMSLRSDLKGSS